MNRFYSLAALLCLLLLTACAAGQTPPVPPEEPAPTLEDLCGADYQSYLIDTLTMQMENRMDKNPEVAYLPVKDDKPLTDYAAVDETLAFSQDENGSLVITLPAGSVTDEAHGEQRFIVPLP